MAKNPNYNTPITGKESPADWEGRSGMVVANYINDKTGFVVNRNGTLYGFRSQDAYDDTTFDPGADRGTPENPSLWDAPIEQRETYIVSITNVSTNWEDDILHINITPKLVHRPVDGNPIEITDPTILNNIKYSYKINNDSIQNTSGKNFFIDFSNRTNGNYSITFYASYEYDSDGITYKNTGSKVVGVNKIRRKITLKVNRGASEIDYTKAYVLTTDTITLNITGYDNTTVVVTNGNYNEGEITIDAIGITTIRVTQGDDLLEQFMLLVGENTEGLIVNNITKAITNYRKQKLFDYYIVGENEYEVRLKDLSWTLNNTKNSLYVDIALSNYEEATITLEINDVPYTINFIDASNKPNIVPTFVEGSDYELPFTTSIDGYAGEQQDGSIRIYHNYEQSITLGATTPTFFCITFYSSLYVKKETESPLFTLGNVKIYRDRLELDGYESAVGDYKTLNYNSSEKVCLCGYYDSNDELLYIFEDGCISRVYKAETNPLANTITINTNNAVLNIFELSYLDEEIANFRKEIMHYYFFKYDLDKLSDNLNIYDSNNEVSVDYLKENFNWIEISSDDVDRRCIFPNRADDLSTGGHNDFSSLTFSFNKTSVVIDKDVLEAVKSGKKIVGQGTSSKEYAIWNWTILLNNENSFSPNFFSANTALYPKQGDIRRWTCKVNWASSMQSHKAGAVTMYNYLYKQIVDNTAFDNAAVWQVPVLLFENRNGVSTFYGIGTFGPDKKDASYFGDYSYWIEGINNWGNGEAGNTNSASNWNYGLEDEESDYDQNSLEDWEEAQLFKETHHAIVTANEYSDDLLDNFNIKSLLFHEAFCLLIAASDNRAKNTYFVIPDNSLPKIELFQDDLDTIFLTDNRGIQSKPFWLEPQDQPDSNNLPDWNSDGHWEGYDNKLFNYIRENKLSDLKNTLTSIYDALAHAYTNVESAFDKFFLSIQEYFPVSIYNEVSYLYYIKAYEDGIWTASDSSKSKEMLSQANGNCYKIEKKWIKERLYYLGNFIGKIDYIDYKGLNNTNSDQASLYVKVGVPCYLTTANQTNVGLANSGNRCLINTPYTVNVPSSASSNTGSVNQYYISDILNIDALGNTTVNDSDYITNIASNNPIDLTINAKNLNTLEGSFNTVNLSNILFIDTIDSSDVETLIFNKPLAAFNLSTNNLKKLEFNEGVYGEINDEGMTIPTGVTELVWNNISQDQFNSLVLSNLDTLTKFKAENNSDFPISFVGKKSALDALMSIDVVFKADLTFANNDVNTWYTVKLWDRWKPNSVKGLTNSTNNASLKGRTHWIKQGTQYKLEGTYNTFTKVAYNNLTYDLTSSKNKPLSISIILDNNIIPVTFDDNYKPNVTHTAYYSGYISNDATLSYEGGVAGKVFYVDEGNSIAYIATDSIVSENVSFGRFGTLIASGQPYSSQDSYIDAFFGDEKDTYKGYYDASGYIIDYPDARLIGGGKANTEALLNLRNDIFNLLQLSIDDCNSIGDLSTKLGSLGVEWPLMTNFLSYEAASICDYMPKLLGNKWWLGNAVEIATIQDKLNDLFPMGGQIWTSSSRLRDNNYIIDVYNKEGQVDRTSATYPTTKNNRHVLPINSIYYGNF